MQSKISTIRKKILPILKKRGVKRAAIFGSTARGENKKKSDIDILVEFKGKKTLFDLGGLYNDLEAKLKKKVDIVTYKSLDLRLRKTILSEKIDVL